MPAVDVTTLTPGDLVKGGTFVHAAPGRLQITFQAQWRINGGDYDSAGSIILRAFVGSGAGREMALLSPFGTTARFERLYAGGYADLPVGIEYVDHEVSGPVLMNMSGLVITCNLFGGA